MLDPLPVFVSCLFVGELDWLMESPLQSGFRVVPVLIRDLPGHFDIRDQGSRHPGRRTANPQNPAGSIDRRPERSETSPAIAARDLLYKSSAVLQKFWPARIVAALPRARVAIRIRVLAVPAVASAVLPPVQLSLGR